MKVKNRWLIALSAVGIHISIGSVYAYSVMTKPVGTVLGCEASQVKIAFMLAIFFLGMTAAFLGRLVEKIGPQKSAMIAALCYGVGIAGSGLAVQVGSIKLFYFFYGVLGGVGFVVAYITPVSTLVKWFPDKRGLATGMAIMGFGFAALIFGPIMANLFIDHLQDGVPVYSSASIAKTFYILGAVYFVLIFLSSLYIAKPPVGWLPAHMEAAKEGAVTEEDDLAQLDAAESLKTKRLYLLWLMMFINISCGIALISSASPLVQEIFKVSATEAGVIVGLMGIFNGLGRFLWSSFSDFLGRANTFCLFFVLQISAFAILPGIRSVLLFQIVLYLIITCYGGGFAVLPAFLGDLFGTKQLGAIHGMVLSAWAMAGLAGPKLLSFLQVHFHNDYQKIFPVFVGLFIFALCLALILVWDIRRLRKQKETLVKAFA